MNLGAENNRFDTGYFKDIDVENGITGGVNVTQTDLGGETSALTTGNTDASATLDGSINDFDIIFVNMVVSYGNAKTQVHTITIPSSAFNADGYPFVISDYNTDYIDGAITFTSNTVIRIWLGDIKGYSSVKVGKVIGIKLTKNLDNATSLDETLLYSGNDQITATTGSTAYTLSNDITNFDYILVTIYGINSDTTQSVNVFAKVPVADSYGFDFNTQGHASYINSYGGWFILSNNQIEFAVRYRGENISSVALSSVIGIKKNSLSTADIAEMTMPSKVNITIPDVIDDSTYTATANGLVQVQAIPSSSSLASVYIRTLDSSSNIIRTSRNINYGSTVSIFCQHTVAKGDTIGFGLVGCTASSVKFFYSVGDAKALGLI